MAEFLSRRVAEGKLEFDSVPNILKDAVRQILQEEYDITIK